MFLVLVLLWCRFNLRCKSKVDIQREWILQEDGIGESLTILQTGKQGDSIIEPEVVWKLDDSFVTNTAQWYKGQVELRGKDLENFEYKVFVNRFSDIR